MQAHVLPPYIRQRRMSRAEYDRLVMEGWFHDERIELIDGILVEMAPIGPPHCDPIDVLNRRFVTGVGDRATVRVQLPFAAGDFSEPEPDLALVPAGRYGKEHPSHAFLIVEVAESSLRYDRETKAPLYAACGVDEYWIVDVNAWRIEVYDRPADGRFTRVRTFDPGESVAPAAFGELAIGVNELFT
jgi:Uma2 family endonuclease